MSINTLGKIAIGVGALGVIGVGGMLLAGCGGPKEQDPESKLLEDFQKFDRNPRDNNWTQAETNLFTVGRPYIGARHNTYRIGDTQFYEQSVLHTETTSNMDRLFAAARGNDAVASLAELKSVALRFDADKNGTLNRSERRDFDNQFEASERSRTIVDSTTTGFYIVDNYPTNPGGYVPPTSGGDDSGYIPPTSGGDDNGGYVPPSNGGGYVPPSNGGNTGGGDDNGGGYVPPSNGGGSTPPSNGNSTDNGNPDTGDF